MGAEYMTSQVKREDPIRWAVDPATRTPQLQILTEFWAWSMGISADHLNSVKSDQGEVPQELIRRARNKWDEMGGVHIAALAWMGGAE